jgi:transposase
VVHRHRVHGVQVIRLDRGRVGIDEISYRRGQRYLVVVIDHDTGRLVWAADGRDGATVERFFRLLGRRRCRRITEVSADGASWITGSVLNHIETIVVTLERHLSNAIVEALNTRIRLLTRRAFGFHSAAPLIALATLSFGGQRPALPGRSA